MKNKNLLHSFKYAFTGIHSSVKKERNIKIHISIMLLVIFMGLLLKINYHEWLTCLVLFALVLSSELINTAIEITLNLITTEINPHVKHAKDISAGAVLINAIFSAIIGLIIFIPKIINLISLHI